MALGWENLGYIDFDANGTPQFLPFWNPPDPTGRLDPIIRTVRPALNSFLFDGFCDLSRIMESGFRAAGALSNASTHLAARSRAGCRGPNPGPTTVVPADGDFVGGQCVTNYRIEYGRVVTATGQVNFSDEAAIGPIVSVSFRVVNGVWWRTIVDNGGARTRDNSLVVTSAVHSRLFVSRVWRVDGLPDDCGSRPGNPQLPPPSGLPAPPLIGEVIINQQYRNINIGSQDNSIKRSISLGPFIWGNDLGVNFDIGDIPIRLLPDLTVQVGRGDGSPPGPGEPDETPLLPPEGGLKALERIANEIDQFDNRLLQQLEDIERDLESIGQELDGQFSQVEGVFSALDCEGEVLEYPFAGRGIPGIASMLNAGIIAVQQTPAVVCDDDDSPVLGPLVLAIAGFVDDVYESRVLSFGNEVRRVVLVVDPVEARDIYRLDNQLTMGKFGWWGVGPIYDGVPTPLKWEQVTLTHQAFDLDEVGWGMRLTLNRGVGYSVFIQEE